MARKKKSEEVPVTVERRVDGLLTFEAEGKRYSLAPELLGDVIVKTVPVKGHAQDDDSDKFEAAGLGLREWVLIQFLSRLGWTMDDIASEIGVERTLLVEWIRAQKITRGRQWRRMEGLRKTRPAKVEEYHREFTEKYVSPPEPKPKKPPAFNVNKVVDLLEGGMGPREVARALKATADDFMPWYQRNLFDINREYTKRTTIRRMNAAGAEIQRRINERIRD